MLKSKLSIPISLMVVLEHIRHAWPMSNPYLKRWVSYPGLLNEFWWNWERYLSDTWLNLVSHELKLAIKSLFSFFNECTYFTNSPSCCVLEASNTLSNFVSLTWTFQISFTNFSQLFLIFFFLWVYAFLDFAELNLLKNKFNQISKEIIIYNIALSKTQVLPKKKN